MLGTRWTSACVVAGVLLGASCSDDEPSGRLGVMGNAVFSWSCVRGDCQPESQEGFGLSSNVLESIAIGSEIDVDFRFRDEVPHDEGRLDLSSPDRAFDGYEARAVGRALLLAWADDDRLGDFIWLDSHPPELEPLSLVYACDGELDPDFDRDDCGEPIPSEWTVGDRVRVEARPSGPEYTWSTSRPELMSVSPDHGEIVTLEMLDSGSVTLEVSSFDHELQRTMYIESAGPTRTRPSHDETGDESGTSGGSTGTSGGSTDTGTGSSSTGGAE